MSTGKVVLGVIAGAGERKMDALKDKFSDVVESITDKFEKVKVDVTDLIHDAELTAEKVEKDLIKR